MKSFSDYIIDTKAILYNIKQFKKFNPKTKICAVVKADGYGLGLENFIKQIERDVDFFAVACFLEAIKLRKITNNPILILNFVPCENLQKCVENNISVSVFNLQHLMQIKKYVKKGKLKIHLAINTGMNRIGFSCVDKFNKSINLAQKQANIKIEGVFTHFYNATNQINTYEQFCIFNHFVKISKKNNLKGIMVHTSASDAGFLYKQFNFDMVRLGMSIYGYSNANVDLRPVLSITSKVINICKVKKGQSVGYGKFFVAKKDMSIATIPLGYADGIMRSYAKKGKVIINNKFCKIVGNICMDMFMCDVTNIKVKMGDKVIFLGKDNKNNIITAEDIAKDCETISYEILTNIKRNRFNVIKK